MLLVRQRLSRTLSRAGPMLRFVTQCRWTYAISFLRLPSLTETTCLLLTYVLNLGVNAVDHTVPSNNTGLTLNAYVFSCSTPSFSSPLFSSPANSSPANSAIPLSRQTLVLSRIQQSVTS